MSTGFHIVYSVDRSPDGRRKFESASFWVTLDTPRKLVWRHDTIERFNRIAHCDFMEFAGSPTFPRRPYHIARLLWVLASVEDPTLTIGRLAEYATQRTWDDLRTKVDRMIVILQAESQPPASPN